LQLLPVLEHALGTAEAAALMRRAGIAAPPDGRSMIPEAQAAALHRRLRAEHPARAPLLAAGAGARTADYLLAHRIPAPVRHLLRHLPANAAAAILSRAIARNAWTFAGSGAFRRETAWRFSIAANPLVAGERGAAPLCHWHAAVFERLYRELVAPDARCVETRCTAQGAGGPCTFVISRDRAPGARA
jgi:divinyl protochlorophyllide a 8-vinyl-reductase